MFAPLAFGRNLEQIPNHLVSGVPEPTQVTDREGLAKTQFHRLYIVFNLLIGRFAFELTDSPCNRGEGQT